MRNIIIHLSGWHKGIYESKKWAGSIVHKKIQSIQKKSEISYTMCKSIFNWIKTTTNIRDCISKLAVRWKSKAK